MTRSCAASALLFAIILPPTAEAAIIDSNDLSLPSYQSADLMNITTDTSTGLDWLDVGTTTGKSFNTVSALLGSGELANFRYATTAEVDVFFNHLGIPTFPLPDTLTTPDLGHTLFNAAESHTGRTNVDAPGVTLYAQGFSGDFVSPGRIRAPYYQRNLVPAAVLSTGLFTTEVSRSIADIGSWLVRISAPDSDEDGIPDSVDNCLLLANYPGANGFLEIRNQMQSIIDDAGTPVWVAEELEEKVLKKVNSAFEEFLKGHPDQMGNDLKDAIKKLLNITNDYGYDTSTLQANIASLAVSHLCGLIDRVGAVAGPPGLADAEDRLSEALTALSAGEYELAAKNASNGSKEIKNPEYVGNFCPATRAEVYFDRLCEIQLIHGQVADLFVNHPQDGKLKDARNKLRDGLRKLAVLDVKEASKKFCEAGDKLAEVTALDVTPEFQALAGLDSIVGVAGLLAQYLDDAAASGNNPDGLIEALEFFGLGEIARGIGDYGDALENYKQAAAKAKP